MNHFKTLEEQDNGGSLCRPRAAIGFCADVVEAVRSGGSRAGVITNQRGLAEGLVEELCRRKRRTGEHGQPEGGPNSGGNFSEHRV